MKLRFKLWHLFAVVTVVAVLAAVARAIGPPLFPLGVKWVVIAVAIAVVIGVVGLFVVQAITRSD